MKEEEGGREEPVEVKRGATSLVFGGGLDLPADQEKEVRRRGGRGGG